jgi:hypothetical protein
VERELRFPQVPRFGADYWLCRCQGFTVEASGRRVGLVDAVRFGTRLDRPDVLLVRGGLLGRRLLSVPVGEVALVSPHERRVLVHGPVGIGTHGLTRLCGLYRRPAWSAVVLASQSRARTARLRLDRATRERWAEAARERGLPLDRFVRETVEAVVRAADAPSPPTPRPGAKHQRPPESSYELSPPRGRSPTTRQARIGGARATTDPSARTEETSAGEA